MASIKDLILSIESADSSFDEKLAAINKMEETLVAMRQQEEQAVQDNVDLIVEAIKLMEKKVTDQLEIAKSIVPEKGDKGDKGERGADGKAGRDGLDGRDGKDGRDGVDGADGVSVTDAKIDFDGSLVITLSTGREINVGEVVAPDLAEKIKVIQTMSTNGAVAILDEGTSISGGVKSINFVGATVTATNSGDDVTVNLQGSVYDPTNVAITGGNINGTTIGGTTPAAGTFTTLTATGQTSLGGVAGSESLRVLTPSATGAWASIQSVTSTGVHISSDSSSGNIDLVFNTRATGSFRFRTSGSLEQFRVTHTASAVNYVQVAGSATGGAPTISAQGSDANVRLTFSDKASGGIQFNSGSGARQFYIGPVPNAVNYFYVNGNVAGSAPVISVLGTDTNIDLTLTPKGTGQANIGTNFANYFALSGAPTTKAVEIKALGSDTNIAFVIDSKGTGAIDLAAGSSGVNISNGGTVTAITRTAAGSAYTSLPTVAITAPTTAGGVQATATATMELAAVTQTVVNGGTGYTVNDVLTISGGTFGTAAQFVVTAVSGGVITAVVRGSIGVGYTALPTNPVSVTGGTGTGATFNASWGITNVFTITNAGSGYVEQPTVTFSGGGGGSGAVAYATVGSAGALKFLGPNSTIQNSTGTAIQFVDGGTSTPVALVVKNANSAQVYPSVTNSNLLLSGNGTGYISFQTATLSFEQLRITNTSSAVNYVQVTGAATTVAPQITAQGSDTNIAMVLSSKGTSDIQLRTNNTGQIQFQVLHTASAVNRPTATGSIAGAAPVIGVAGSDTNIDLALTPKGTGRVKFGTYTANMALTVQGYIEILDSGGTVRKLAVIA